MPKGKLNVHMVCRDNMSFPRRDWFAGQLDLDPARLVFIDETGASTNMARSRGCWLRV